MKRQFNLILFFSLLVIFAITSAIFAAEVLKQSVPGKTSGQSATIQKRSSIIKIDKGILAMKYQEQKVLRPELYNSWKKVTDNYKLIPNKIAAEEQQVKIYLKQMEECENKDFTQSDQKNAGCTDNDTISNCSMKLAYYCMKTVSDEVQKKQNDLKNTVKNLRDATDEMKNACEL
jgi:hypothetical protein